MKIRPAPDYIIIPQFIKINGKSPKVYIATIPVIPHPLTHPHAHKSACDYNKIYRATLT